MSKEIKIPDWLLERYRLGELPEKKRRQLEKELQENPALAAELEELSRSDREILSTYPAARLVPEIRKRVARQQQEPISKQFRFRPVLIAIPAMALAILMLVVLPPLFRQKNAFVSELGHENYIGVKGEKGLSLATPGLQIFRKRAAGIEKLTSNSQAKVGDLLQLAYSSGSETNGMIFSIDGNGAVTLHFPENKTAATTLQKGRRIFLPRAYELDNAPQFERFFLVVARGKINVNEILQKARELAVAKDNVTTGNLNLPEQFRQFSLLIRK